MKQTLRGRLVSRWMGSKRSNLHRRVGRKVAARRLYRLKRKVRQARLGTPLPSLLSAFPRIEITKDADVLQDPAAARAEVRKDLRRDFQVFKSRMRGLVFHTVFVGDDLAVTVWPKIIGRRMVRFEGGAERFDWRKN